MPVSLLVANIPVQVTRKPIKNMYLRVQPETGQVKVSAPERFSDEVIKKFVFSRLEWIEKQIEREKSASQEETFPPADQLIWGAPRRVLIIEGGQDCSIQIQGSDLLVASPQRLTAEMWESMINWLMRKLVGEAAPPLIALWRQKLGLPQLTLGVRQMKSRWGTCYPAKRRIILNSSLAAKQPACLEHVIVHELLHFFELNHGPDFKRLMDHWLPSWRSTAELLKGR